MALPTDDASYHLAQFLACQHGGDPEEYLELVDEDYEQDHPLEHQFVSDGVGAASTPERTIGEIPAHIGAMLTGHEQILEQEVKPHKRKWTPEEREQRGLSPEQQETLTEDLTRIRDELYDALGSESEVCAVYDAADATIRALLDHEQWFDAHQLVSILESKFRTMYVTESDVGILRRKIGFRSEQLLEAVGSEEESRADLITPYYQGSVVDLVAFFVQLEDEE